MGVAGALAVLVAAAVVLVMGGGAGNGTRATGADTDGGEQVEAMAPLPKARPRVVEPVAGEISDARGGGKPATPAAVDAAVKKAVDEDSSLPKPTRPATVTKRGSADGPSVRNLSVARATALPNGVALPPLEAPEAVMEIIRAGNTIARSPYKWGGGHGRFLDNGYDCSGSVSFALYVAGLIEGPRTSGQLESWAEPGKGKWVTVYANAGHTFMEVAGIRFDTSGARRTGSRWQNEFRPTGGYVARHPRGL